MAKKFSIADYGTVEAVDWEHGRDRIPGWSGDGRVAVELLAGGRGLEAIVGTLVASPGLPWTRAGEQLAETRESPLNWEPSSSLLSRWLLSSSLSLSLLSLVVGVVVVAVVVVFAVFVFVVVVVIVIVVVSAVPGTCCTCVPPFFSHYLRCHTRTWPCIAACGKGLRSFWAYALGESGYRFGARHPSGLLQD